jgi:hypothetical protein
MSMKTCQRRKLKRLPDRAKGRVTMLPENVRLDVGSGLIGQADDAGGMGYLLYSAHLYTSLRCLILITFTVVASSSIS